MQNLGNNVCPQFIVYTRYRKNKIYIQLLRKYNCIKAYFCIFTSKISDYLQEYFYIKIIKATHFGFFKSILHPHSDDSILVIE